MSRELEEFQLVLLRRPSGAPEYDEETLDRLQDEHLAFLDGLRDRGVVAAYGPVLDQPDPSLRGLVVYRTGSAEEAREHAEQDPLVRAGRLAVEVMTFLTAPGSITPGGIPIRLD